MLTISMWLSHHSNCSDASQVGWRVTQISRQLSVCHASGISSAPMGKYSQAMLIPWQISIWLQHGGETRAHTCGEATWAFLTGMEQPLAESPTSPTREERELQASRPYGTPLVDLRQMLEGDVPQDKMTCLFFVKEGIRKLSDLNTVIGNNTQFILIGGTW